MPRNRAENRIHRPPTSRGASPIGGLDIAATDRSIVSVMLRVLLVAAPLLPATSAGAQTVRFVDAGGADVGDCSDPESPCETITYALDQSAPGDVIEIADGAYSESFEIDKDIALHGESEAGTLIQAHAVAGAATERVITIDGNHDVEISELTIRHGVAIGEPPANLGGGIYLNGAELTVSDVTFFRNEADASGGGVFVEIGSPSFSNVTFSRNLAGLGGGVFNGVGNFPTFTNVTFIENQATGLGGGMNNWESSPVLENVEFIDNVAGHQGGGMFTAICQKGCTQVLENVTFRGNFADQSGGGMFSATFSTPLLENVIFDQNEAGKFGGGMLTAGSLPTLKNVTFTDNSAGFGGAMFIQNDSPTLVNVAFIGNEAVGAGGAIRIGTTSPNLLDRGSGTFTNVTFGGNSAGSVGGAISNATTITLVNCIVWGNTAGIDGNEIFNAPSSIVRLRHSLYGDGPGDIVEGLIFEAENSLTVDPLYVDPEGENLRLMDASPAIDAGDPETDPTQFPVDEDGDPVDLDGNPRFVPDESSIDIGAYEVSQGSATISIADRPEKELNNGLHLMRFTLTLSSASNEPVSVAFATEDDTAIDGVDYFAAAGTVTFEPGETSAGVFVAIISNTVVDGNRSFFVHLSNPDGATIADGTAIGAIIDDDVALCLTCRPAIPGSIWGN